MSPVFHKGKPTRLLENRAEFERVETVRALGKRMANLFGIGEAGVLVTGDLKTGARLTSSGIELMLNPVKNEAVAEYGGDMRAKATVPPPPDEFQQRIPSGTGDKVVHASQRAIPRVMPAGMTDKHGLDVKGTITVDEVDTISACFAAAQAQDFLDASYGQIDVENDELTTASRNYFEGMIDDMAAEMRIQRLPYIAKRFEAYVSRHETHQMLYLPLERQLMKTLRLYLFESVPDINVRPIILGILGSPEQHTHIVESMRKVLADESLDYRQRHLKARAVLESDFIEMARLDATTYTSFEMMHLFDDEDFYNASTSFDDDTSNEQADFESARHIGKKLQTVTKQNIEQLILKAGEDKLPEDLLPTLRLPGLREEARAFLLDKSLDEDYKHVFTEGKTAIDELAQLFIQIAQPKESLSVPRYNMRLKTQGLRINPRAIIAAHRQLETGIDANIWQGIDKISRYQTQTFNGLDVFLLIDVSFSMLGPRALNAAIMAMYLTEGLEKAYELCKSTASGGTVDIRTQLLAFGLGWTMLTPLSTVHSHGDKLVAFRTIQFPASNKTIVGGALNHVGSSARSNPDREVLCIVVSDGRFTDNLRARKIAMGLPSNTYLGHINIGPFEGIPISENFEAISNPSSLPEKMGSVLRQRLQGKLD